MIDLFGITHHIVLCKSSDIEKWKSGELIYDFINDELVESAGKEIKPISVNDEVVEYLTYDDFFDENIFGFETFYKTMTTESGETIVAFGYYGYFDENDY